MKNLFLLILLGVFTVSCLLVQHNPTMSRLRSALQVNHVPSEMLAYNKLGEVFQKLGLVNVIPNHSKRFPQPSDGFEVEPAGPFQKRRQVGGALLTTSGEHVLMAQARAGLTGMAAGPDMLLLSIVTEEENLLGPAGIISNFNGRGKKWEKLAYFALARGERLIDSGAAGLRLHGGKSRHPGLPLHNYRLYWRKKYGEKQLASKELFPELSPLRTLVVHKSVRPDWPLNTVIANELYASLGVETLPYRPVRFILNGREQGVYWLSPHLSEKFIRQKEGLDSIYYQRFKGKGTLDKYRSDIGSVAYDFSHPLTAQRVSQVVDLEGLTNYFIGITFSGNTDWNQGVAFRGVTDDTSRWRYIAWDLDHSFIDWYGAGSSHPERSIWQQDGLGLFFSPRLKRVRSRRQMLLRRLLEEDAQYRQLFVQRYVDVLNHQLSPDSLHRIFVYYRDLLAEYDVAINPLLEEFFSYRQEQIRGELAKEFDLGPFYDVVVTAGETSSLKIDGVTETLPYHGRYPEGYQLRLEYVGDGQEVVWQEENLSLPGKVFSVSVSKDMAISMLMEEH